MTTTLSSTTSSTSSSTSSISPSILLGTRPNILADSIKRSDGLLIDALAYADDVDVCIYYVLYIYLTNFFFHLYMLTFLFIFFYSLFL